MSTHVLVSLLTENDGGSTWLTCVVGTAPGFSWQDSESTSEICCPLSASTGSSDSSTSLSVSMTGTSSGLKKKKKKEKQLLQKQLQSKFWYIFQHSYFYLPVSLAWPEHTLLGWTDAVSVLGLWLRRCCRCCCCRAAVLNNLRSWSSSSDCWLSLELHAISSLHWVALAFGTGQKQVHNKHHNMNPKEMNDY